MVVEKRFRCCRYDPMDWYKALDKDEQLKLLSILNDWWNKEEFPEEHLLARVV